MRSGTYSRGFSPRARHLAAALLCLGLLAPGRSIGAPPEVPLALELDSPAVNHDDPCFWVDPHERTRGLLFVTLKTAGVVEVYDLPTGTLTATIPGFLKANNCVVEGDWLLTTDAFAHHVTVHHLPDLTAAGTLAEDMLLPMGIATLHAPDGRTLVYVTDEGDASVHVYDLATRALVHTFPTGFGLRIEPVVADDRYQRVFIAREERGGRGIGLFTPDGLLEREFGASAFGSDTEGLALYTCGEGGYLVAADQHMTATEFEIFDRVSLAHLGTFRMQDGTGEYTSATDGIDILQTPLPGFPSGMLAACDGCNDNLPDQVEIAPWDRIADVMGLDRCPDGIEPDCVTAPCIRRLLPVADASVLGEAPDMALGANPALVLDADPGAETLLRFDIPDLTGFDLRRATLRLTVESQKGADGEVGGALFTTTGDWQEDTVTWTTRPRALLGPVAGAGPVTLAQAVDFDVRPVVHSAGSADFLLRTTSTNRVRYRSREAGVSPPALLLALHKSTPPAMRLAAPEDGVRIDPGQPLVLAARASDDEDGDLTAAIRWRSDRDGALGTGGDLRITTLRHGRHTLQAAVVDGAGLRATTAVHILVDTAPTLLVDSPAEAMHLPGGQRLLLHADAHDAEDGDLGTAIAWASDRDGPLGTGTDLQVVLREGTHRLTATVRDADSVPATVARTVVVTPSAPVVTITTPAPGAVGVSDQTVAFAGGALDFADGDLRRRLEWISDLQGALGTGALLTATGLVPGTHVVTARATDRDGLGGQAQVMVRIVPPTLVLPAVADAYVRADLPATNYGRSTTLQISSRPERQAFLRFVVDGTAGVDIARATLRLTVSTSTGSSSASGGTLSIAPDAAWEEKLVTWDTRPVVGAPLASTGAVTRGQRVDFDVTAAVTGDGPVAFALTSPSADTAKYNSRQATTGRPALVLHLRSTLATPDAPPTVTMLSPPDATVVTLGQPVTFAATVTDADEPGLTTGLAWTSDRTGALGTGSPLTVTDLPAGRHHIRAEVRDANGSLGVARLTVIVNAPPRLAITFPADDVSVSAGTPIVLEATADDFEDGPLGPAVSWASDRTGVLGHGARLGLPRLPLGPHRVTATVRDAAGATAAATHTITVTAGTLAFAPVADATVKADTPDTNFGTSFTLQADADPARRAYLRFAVTGLAGARVTAAVLRLTVRPDAGSGSVGGGALVRLDPPPPWGEKAITFTTSPLADGPPRATIGPVADGAVVTLDLTGVVTADGLYDFALVPTSTDRVAYSSREAGPDRPQLLVTVE